MTAFIFFYSVSCFFAGLICLALGINILRQSRGRLEIIYFLLTLAFFFAGTSDMFLRSAASPQIARFWGILRVGGYIMACTFFLHFSLIFADRKSKILPVFYAASLIMFSLFSFTPYYLKDFEKHFFGYIYVPGSWNISFILFYLTYGLLGLYLVFNVYRTGKEYFRKKQAQYILGAITLLIVLGTVFDQFFLMLKIPTLPLATHISAAALGLIGYVILKYRPITTVSKEQISEAAADALLDAMFLTDADQKVNFANQAACQLSGFRIDQILGKGIKEILVMGEDGIVRLKQKKGTEALIDLKIFKIEGEKGKIYLGRDLMAVERSKADTKRINAQLKKLIEREEKVKKYLYQLSKIENMDELNKILKILELEDKEIRALLEPVHDVVLENIKLFEETHRIRDSLVKKTNELKELIKFLSGRDEILEGLEEQYKELKKEDLKEEDKGV